MTKEAEYLKKKAEISGIEPITYEEQVKIARHLLKEHDSLEPVCQWFEDRHEMDYSHERTLSHLETIMDLSEASEVKGMLQGGLPLPTY